MKEWIERHPWRLLAVVIAVLLLAFAFGYFESAGGQTTSTLPPKGTFVGPSPYDEHLIELDKQALDDSYRKQLDVLFSSWMRDDTAQPQRLTVGIQQARRAYILSMGEIEKRARDLQQRKQ